MVEAETVRTVARKVRPKSEEMNVRRWRWFSCRARATDMVRGGRVEWRGILCAMTPTVSLALRSVDR